MLPQTVVPRGTKGQGIVLWSSGCKSLLFDAIRVNTTISNLVWRCIQKNLRPSGRRVCQFSVYVNAVEGKNYLAELYGAQLGKVKIGKSSISFRNRTDINLDVLREMVEHAGRIVTTDS